ncbi:Phosphatidate cytidylyltransferase [Mucinivorans hirudinis]|uniref:Phosphatidate cytidylyltransferase n=1 Tax=Mucinivorans hirudinis TaxID=1433126 RepID=A0A060RDR0_9BACT|nr:Phosphatidate cytidylyltransferase [Mucinivorans hirudinis]
MKKLITRTITGIVFVWVIVEGTLWTEWSFYLLWVIIALLSLNEYFTLVRRSDVFKSKLLPYLVGGVYIAGAIWILTTMQPEMVVTILTIVWANDTGAFIVGSTIGKHKIAPKISPKKSWEGFFGGVVFAVGVALVWYALYWSDSQATIAPLFQDEIVVKWLWVALGVVVAVAAFFGDLLESKFKRLIGVKDSGAIIPGHGGMLDRFDAALLAIPAAKIFIALLF